MANPPNASTRNRPLDFQMSEIRVAIVPRNISTELLSSNLETSAAITENRVLSLPVSQSLSPVQSPAAESYKNCIALGREVSTEKYLLDKEMLLGLSIHKQAIHHYRVKNYSEVLRLDLEALALYEKLSSNTRLVLECLEHIATICHELGYVYSQLKNLQEAHNFLTRSVVIYTHLRREGKTKVSSMEILKIAEDARQVLDELNQ